MNCTEWEERVALHAGGDLPAGEAVEVERHLGECAGCQVLWSGLRESLETLRAAHRDTLGPAHFTAVRARVLAELERSRPWWRWVWAGGLAAAALAVVLGLGMWPVRTPPPPRIALSLPPAPVMPAPVMPQDPVHVAQPLAHARGSERSRDRKGAVLTHSRRAGKRPALLTVKLQTSDPNIVIYWIAD